MSLLESALSYQAQGYNIIPVGKDKRPLLASWRSYQTNPASAAQVEQWWTVQPDANIAAICGHQSGFFVVDIDPGADISGLHLPPTKIVRTGRGGWHYYYKWGEHLKNVPNTVNIRPHIDLRGEGSYILIPPSINEHGPYELISDIEMADLPLNVLPPAKRVAGSWQKLLKGAQNGSRNASLASVLGGLTRAIPPIYWEDILWPFCEWWNQYRCTPPLPKNELYATFNSICKKSLDQNWSSWIKEE